MRNGLESISNFIFLEDDLRKSDIILVPGSSQIAQIKKAVELYYAGYGQYIIISGGENPKVYPHVTEAEYFYNYALNNGVPSSDILIDKKARHTFDNARLSLELLHDKKVLYKKAIIVCKGYHSRRAFLTYKSIFPKTVQFFVCIINGERNISKQNWVDSPDKIKKVLGEVEKIGKYFPKYISVLRT